MFIELEDLKNIDIFNDFYKIKCDAIFTSDSEENNIMVVLCTIHGNHYFILIAEHIVIKKVEDDIDLYLCFENQFRMKGYSINEELIIYKNTEDIFECNFFTIKNLEVWGRRNILLLKNKDFSCYQKKELIYIANDIFTKTIFCKEA